MILIPTLFSIFSVAKINNVLPGIGKAYHADNPATLRISLNWLFAKLISFWVAVFLFCTISHISFV